MRITSNFAAQSVSAQIHLRRDPAKAFFSSAGDNVSAFAVQSRRVPSKGKGSSTSWPATPGSPVSKPLGGRLLRKSNSASEGTSPIPNVSEQPSYMALVERLCPRCRPGSAAAGLRPNNDARVQLQRDLLRGDRSTRAAAGPPDAHDQVNSRSQNSVASAFNRGRSCGRPPESCPLRGAPRAGTVAKPPANRVHRSESPCGNSKVDSIAPLNCADSSSEASFFALGAGSPRPSVR